MKKINISGIVTAVLLLFNACHSSKKDDPNYIKVGITSGPEQEIAEAAKKVAKESITLRWNSFLSMIM
jgi:D-methionine transport system substrate-binding protein